MASNLSLNPATLSCVSAADQNLLLYNTIGSRDSLLVNIHLQDSVGNTADTTVYLKFREGTPENFTHTVSKLKLLGHKRTLEFQIAFSKPVSQINFDSLYLQLDSITRLPIEPKEINYDEPTRLMTVIKKIPPGYYTKPPDAEDREAVQSSDQSKLNELHIHKAAFISAESDTSSRTVQEFNVRWEADLGVIIAQTKAKSSTILQLVDQKLNVVKSIPGNKATFADLEPSVYLLRMIIDENGNGRWDAGNYLKKKEPEQIIYYKTEKGDREINLKANFEIGPLLITY